MLDSFHIVVEDTRFLEKGFADVNLLYFVGVAHCEGPEQLTEVCYGSRPSVFFVALMQDYDKVQDNMRRVMEALLIWAMLVSSCFSERKRYNHFWSVQSVYQVMFPCIVTVFIWRVVRSPIWLINPCMKCEWQYPPVRRDP